MNLSHPHDEENEIGITPADKFRTPTALQLALVAAALSGAQRKPAEALLDEAETLLNAAYDKYIKMKYADAVSNINAQEDYCSKLTSVRVLTDDDFYRLKLVPEMEISLDVGGLDGEPWIEKLPSLTEMRAVRKSAKKLISEGYLAKNYDFKLSRAKSVGGEYGKDLIVDGYHFDYLYTARVTHLAIKVWSKLGERHRPLGASFVHPIVKERTSMDFDFKQLVRGLKLGKRGPKIRRWLKKL